MVYSVSRLVQRDEFRVSFRSRLVVPAGRVCNVHCFRTNHWRQLDRAVFVLQWVPSSDTGTDAAAWFYWGYIFQLIGLRIHLVIDSDVTLTWGSLRVSGAASHSERICIESTNGCNLNKNVGKRIECAFRDNCSSCLGVMKSLSTFLIMFLCFNALLNYWSFGDTFARRFQFG